MSKRKELLSPAGDFESLVYAVNNGADAVYLGGKKFGARKFASNFDNEEMIKAIKYCHLYGVKIYVTVNTLIYDEEIEDALNYLEFLYINGVDAVIMQDLGLITLARKKFPNLEIHASTQMHNINEGSLNHLISLGIKRVVLARELSLKEVSSLKLPIEKEIFIHGALCISYSGECLFSSLINNRSGNRGECSGSCRLKYFLYENEKEVFPSKYLLSTKELNTISSFKEIMDSDVTSLKIEGRMKSKYYVGFVTRVYKALMDKYYNNEDLTITKDDIKKLKLLYNRDFTTGYLFNKEGLDFMNINSPKHQGLVIGKVLDIKNNKVKILLNDTLSQNDGIRFSSSLEGMIVNYLYNDNDLLINKAYPGNIIYLDKKGNVKKGELLLKTLDNNLLKEIDSYPPKRILVNYKVTKNNNNELVITLSDLDNNEVTIKSSSLEKSKNITTSEEDILKSLKRLGNTPYQVNSITIDLPSDIFIPLSILNNLRRSLIDDLTNIRENKIKEHPIINDKITNKEMPLTKTINVLVRNKDQLAVALKYKNINIYLEDNLKYKDIYTNTYYKVSRSSHKVPNYKDKNLLIGDLGSLYELSKNNNVVTDLYLNVTNHYTLAYLSNFNIKRINLSCELDDLKIKEIISSYYHEYHTYPNCELFIYGRIELMMMKYCPLKTLLNKEDKCNYCSKETNFYLKSINNEYYPLISNHCTNYILNYKNTNLIDKISYYQDNHINNFTLSFYDESPKEVENIINKVLSNIR